MPAASGSEEYLHSEKYEIKRWDRTRADSLAPLITKLNAIRRDNPALQHDETIRFHAVSNDQLVVYSKVRDDNRLIIAVNLDPHNVQAGFVELSLPPLGIGADEEFVVHDLLGDARYVWRGARNYIELRPQEMPAHIFRVHER
jgi:starch synthase (maltosyl-transferring)